jgi:NAD(P)-dependent dehydrogenase (short-subunit alcohol dehydrogenase family)
MARLRGRVALITGAGTGIGRATAILFAREGAKAAIAEIDVRAREETAHLAGNEAIAIRADVTRRVKCRCVSKALVAAVRSASASTATRRTRISAAIARSAARARVAADTRSISWV